MVFGRQFANVVEWEEWNEEMIFWKWKNNEIKKGSKLILKPGQDAIFLNNGRVEGIFSEDGEYEVDSQIIPFLSTLKGFKFGFNSGMRCEVLFVNTKEFQVKWGTKTPINIPAPGFPGGMPVRANGNFYFKVTDYDVLIEKLAGIKKQYFVNDIKERITAILNQLLMKWISKEGKDMFNLQANSFDISKGIKTDLDMEIYNDGMSITAFNIMSFNYPQEIQDMITKNASQSMVGDMDRYTQMAMADSMAKGNGGSSTAGNMAEMMMGMKMAEKMVNGMDSSSKQTSTSGGKKFCSECGAKLNGSAKFCPECGTKL